MLAIGTEKGKITRSKYELTLAEFPCFLLSTKTKGIKSFKYEDTISGKNGLEVKREWTVYPDGKYGFGSASTLSTFFELFQIWKESNFDSQSIHFGTLYNLLKRRGLQINKKAYNQIRRDIDCLVGMRIDAKNAFWDNELRAYVDMTFHLFDQASYFKETPDGQAILPFAYIKASDVLYGSVLKNSLLPISFDGEFFHNLKPVEQRLVLYLSKILRSQAFHKRDLFEFAQQIPIQAKQKKHIKEPIKKACEGLIAKGFTLLKSYEFEKGNHDQEFIIFRSGTTPTPKSLPYQFKAKTAPLSEKPPYKVDALVEDILAVCKDDHSKNFYKKVAHLFPETLIYRMISEVKEVRDCMEIKKSKGAVFTSLAQKYAKKHSIDL